jgi:glutamate-1-semialdehyde 2,1-aminomutase
VEGQKYIDFVGSWGPLILGHAYPTVVEAIIKAAQKGSTYGAPTEGETRLAELIKLHMPNVPTVRLVSSGTEAAMSAIRLARGFTGREKIVKFAGCYHGHADSLLVAAGSGLTTLSLPSSLGVPKSLAALTIVAPYNDPESLKKIFEAEGQNIAAVIVELIAGNMGLVLPSPDFIAALKTLPKAHGALLIADEVITGFRVGLGGAQELYGLKPDLTVLGKIIGGGLPLAAFGGPQEITSFLAPQGGVYQAGTLSGNPLAVAAGIATLETLAANPNIYSQMASLTETWTNGLTKIFKDHNLSTFLTSKGSASTVFFNQGPVYNLETALKSDLKAYGAYYRAMRDQGIWLPPSQFETTFLSTAFTPKIVNAALEIAALAVKKAFS